MHEPSFCDDLLEQIEEESNLINPLIVPINEHYEWYQYNRQLKLLHSIDDDMFQYQSIINACNSTKKIKHWMENQNTKEFLAEFEEKKRSVGIPADRKIIENRVNVPNEFKGIYVHRLLVNVIAQWCSPLYAIYIAKLLDDIFEKEREEMKAEIYMKNQIINSLEEQIVEKEEVIQEHKTTTIKYKPRAVPNQKEKDYIFMLVYENKDFSQKTPDDWIRLKCHRLNKKTYDNQRKNYPNYNIIYFKNELPISMTINEDIQKYLNQKRFPISFQNQYNYVVQKKNIENMKKELDLYFETFQNP